MTAISAFRSEHAVHVFSDGLWCDSASGKPGGIGTKVYTIPQNNCIFATTGHVAVPTLLSAQLLENQFAELPSLAEAMPDLIKMCSTRTKALGQNLTGRCDVVLAGWSENTGPLIHLVECHFEHGIFKGRAVDRYIRPTVDASDMQSPEDGLRLLEKQRAAQFYQPDAGTFGGATVTGLVGGFAQHTQVDAEGIRIQVLKRWPDEIE
ncbi:hypothetical protein LPJ38_26475 [Bradyrhizobium daqingense]|uniref:Uncharacterized protein n=1 Tax=Bradyrhizobium daqingense TaxID=993502 RepID=A0A562LMU3_9BRAD|nr:hypothetical protein [Bradyrhizobium daqingense]TWI08913.1 hypothetical protein IQ17_01738 [Bradyrhizobium daqingense]UFS87177.1 hypothetical protein LPJ38_26475 [Bradyrhizobium daqingense]